MNVLRSAWIEYERDRARYLAVAMVYYALISLVPLLLLLVGALGLSLRFLPIAANARQQMLLVIEGNFGPELAVAVTALLDTLQQESIIATVISLAGILLAASVLFKHLRLSFRALWKHEPPLVSGPVRKVVLATILERTVAFAIVLGGGGLLLAALGLLTAVGWLHRLLGSALLFGELSPWLVAALTSLSFAALSFAALFKVLPPVPMRWRDIWLATLLCAVAWVIAGELLALYAVFFGDSRSAYGALGAMLAVMLWMNIVSQVLFFGAELCKVVAARRAPQ